MGPHHGGTAAGVHPDAGVGGGRRGDGHPLGRAPAQVRWRGCAAGAGGGRRCGAPARPATSAAADSAIVARRTVRRGGDERVGRSVSLMTALQDDGRGGPLPPGHRPVRRGPNPGHPVGGSSSVTSATAGGQRLDDVVGRQQRRDPVGTGAEGDRPPEEADVGHDGPGADAPERRDRAALVPGGVPRRGGIGQREAVDPDSRTQPRPRDGPVAGDEHQDQVVLGAADDDGLHDVTDLDPAGCSGLGHARGPVRAAAG